MKKQVLQSWPLIQGKIVTIQVPPFAAQTKRPERLMKNPPMAIS